MDREKGREQAERSIETCVSRKWESSRQDRSSPRLSTAYFQYHAVTVGNYNWDRYCISSLMLSFCFQMHIRLTCTSKKPVDSRLVCVHVLVSLSPRGNYKKNLQQSHVFTALCRSIGFFDMICVLVCVCVCLFVCYLECLWGQYRVISITMEQTDTVSPIPKPRPKATKLMVVECDHSYEMLCAFMCTYSEWFLL